MNFDRFVIPSVPPWSVQIVSAMRTFDGREQENLYDGEGLRAGLKENGKLSTFLYYNGEILAECGGGKTEDSVPVRRYQRGISLFQVEDTAAGISHTYSQDEQKSTIYITRNDGAVENSYAYDAFGNVLESRENIENRIRYTGQQHDQVTGQHYLRARYYNPVIGRFTQEDTYRGDGLNLYAYCGNNPVRYHDPSGHDGMPYSDDSTAGSGQSRVEQVDGEVDSGNVAGVGTSWTDLMSPEDAAKYNKWVDLREAGLDQEKINDIILTNKGYRPEPTTYLSQEYINAHLELFSDGVVKISATTPIGQAGPPGGTFVMPKSVADKIIRESNGNVSKLEQLLSLEPGTLGDSPVRLDIVEPQGLRMSSGNELGANEQWIPGGSTGGGIPEATIDSPLQGEFVSTPIFE